MSRGSAKVVDGTTETKPLRRDAELNLVRILLAARDVFAEHGYEASMEQIAARADVGIGTLYRRFPNKADLCAAVVDAATDRTRRSRTKSSWRWPRAGRSSSSSGAAWTRRAVGAPLRRGDPGPEVRPTGPWLH